MGSMDRRTWSDINTRINECRIASEPIRCLEDLLSQTNDGMVALALGEEYEAKGKTTEACRCYETAEMLFPREEWKEKARVARSRFEGGKTTAELRHAGETLFIVQCTKDKIWTNPSENREFVPAKEAYTGGRMSHMRSL